MKLGMFIAKAAVSAALLYLLLNKFKLATVWQTLQRSDAVWIAAVLLIFIVQVVLGSLRWAVIAASCGLPLRARAAIHYTFIGTFFNQLLPSTIGGDAARIWYLAHEQGGWARGTYSVFIDRVVGMLTLTLLVFLCMPWTFARIDDPAARMILVVVGLMCISGVTGFLALGLLPAKWSDKLWLARHLHETARTTWRVLATARAGSPVIVYSLAINLLSALAWWCTAGAISSSLSFLDALLLVPPVTLIATLPISIGGWGVREGAVVAAFAFAGLSSSDGLVMSLIFGLAGLAVGALGGIFWIMPPPGARPGAVER